MIQLSYSTINNCLQANNSHCWLNKQMGRKIPENEAMRNGRRLHDLIASRRSEFPILNGFYLPKKDFDENLKIKKIIDNEYEIFGFLDGWYEDLGEKGSRILEIKTGTKFWSIMDFQKSMQVKLYGAITDAKSIVCFTTLSDENLWKMQPPKDYEINYTLEMKAEAIKWVHDAIDILEAGTFKGGLDGNGKCNIWCPFGENCYFK